MADIEAFKNRDGDLNKVEFTQVEQPGSVGFFGHMKGFWVTFSTIID